MAAHARWSPAVLDDIERVTTAHLGRTWTCTASADLTDRSSHPAAILHGKGFSVFAKILAGVEASAQVRAELAGLALIQTSGAETPARVGCGSVDREGHSVLLLEALHERPPGERTVDDWQGIGRALATIHGVHGDRFGGGGDGYFGSLLQDNRSVSGHRWSDFYASRRLLPGLRAAQDAGRLPAREVGRLESVIAQLDDLVGAEPRPTLLHGDAQHHNFVSTATGAVVIDACPYFGHPEIDLALVDYFTPVPESLFAAYAEIRPIDPGFPRRRELWRLFAYLAVVTVDGGSVWGRGFLQRLSDAVESYS